MAMEEEMREEYLHFIHNWDANKEDPAEAIVSLEQMEVFLMDKFLFSLPILLDPEEPDAKLFYHDYMEDQESAAKCAKISSFRNKSRQYVRRVLGCGHFILGVIYNRFNILEREHGENFPWLELWQEMKADLVDKDLLNPELPCDYASTYEWLRTLYARIFENWELKENIKEYLRIPFTLLNVVGPCQRDEDDTSEEFMRNYQEFIVFHLHALHELHMLKKGKEKSQYYQMLRRPDMPPITKHLPRSLKFEVVTTKEQRLMRMRKYIKYEYAEVNRVAKQELFPHETLHGIALVVKDGDPSDNGWRQVPNWEQHVTEWRKVTSTMYRRQTGMEWRLGCKGCPKKKRPCRWITIRRAIMVKRIIWRKKFRKSRRA